MVVKVNPAGGTPPVNAIGPGLHYYQGGAWHPWLEGGAEDLLVLKYGQDLVDVSWFAANAALAASRPFDGEFIYLTGASNNAMKGTASLTEASVVAEMGTFHSASLGPLVHNFATIRWTDNEPADGLWWNDSAWATRVANIANFAAGVQGARMSGVVFDNEYYGAGTWPWDWVNGAGIDSTHTLAQAQAKVRQRGQEVMAAIIAEWPDVEVLVAHGPYISDPRTGVDVWTDTVTDPPFWNTVDHANELSAWFTFGLIDEAIGTAAVVIDGGEVYGVRSLTAVENVLDWQTVGMPSGGIVPVELRPSYGGKLAAAQGIYDADEFSTPSTHLRQAPDPLRDQLEWALETRPTDPGKPRKVWLYTERQDWHGPTWGTPPFDHLNIDLATMDPWYNAVATGIARGKGLADPTPRVTAYASPETFEGPHGYPWASYWTQQASSGSSVAIEATATPTYKGRLALSSSGGFTAWARATLADVLPANRDVLVTGISLNGTADQFTSVHWNSDGNWTANDQMSNGWRILWWQGATQQWALIKRVASVETTVFGPVAVSTNNTIQNVRARRVGNELRVKVWAGTGAEPAAWSTSIIDGAVSSFTRLALSLNGGNGTESTRSVDFDRVETSAPALLPIELVSLSIQQTYTANGTLSLAGLSHAPGDLMLAHIVGRPIGTAGANDALSLNQSWAINGTRRRREVGTSDLSDELWYKLATSSAEPSPTLTIGTNFQGTTAGVFIVVTIWRNVDLATPFDVAAVGSDGAAPGSPFDFTGTGLTPATAGAAALSLAGTADDNALSLQTAQGMTAAYSGASYDSVTGADAAQAAAWRIVNPAAAVTMPTWRQTLVGGDPWIHRAVALRPAPV